MVTTAGGGRRGASPVAPTEKAVMYTILLYIPYSSKVSSAEPEGCAAVVSINLSSIIDSSLPPQITKTLENDIFPLFLILIPTKSGTFAHCELVFVNKASTDGGEQQPSSLTGGQPNLQPSNPYLQKAALQPYRRPPQPSSQHPNPAAKHPNPTAKHPTPTTKHPSPAAAATEAAGPIIRDYGITN